MKKWEILNNFKFHPDSIGTNFKSEKVVKIILENRGIKTKKEIDRFVSPKLEDVTVGSVGIDSKQLDKALSRIKNAIDKKEQIIVFGDYDVDGICGAAILWETLFAIGAKTLPYIPHRIDEGYGLSEKGISNIQSKIPEVKLIITVDNGIVASSAVEFAKKQGIDVIITDHHVPSDVLPSAHAIVHTTKLCGTGVAYLLSQEISNQYKIQNTKYEIPDTYLELVVLATIADLVPLTAGNRTLVKFGLEKLQKTNRPGLKAIFKESGLTPGSIGVYEIGHVIAPRINAMGRLESGMDSLRLLCTKDNLKALVLADKLARTNRERQTLTQETVFHAIAEFKTRSEKTKLKNFLFIAEETYQAGVIGLVAGKLVEEFYRPSVVLSKGEKYSKASARSIHGFNIIEFIRRKSDLLVDAGGHPMAAGFTVETGKLELLQEELEKLADELITEDMLIKVLKIDLELPFSKITRDLYEDILRLAPFGMGNPEPTFMSLKVKLDSIRTVGNDSKHLKLTFKDQERIIDGIAFGMGDKQKDLKSSDYVDIAYSIDLNDWNGNKKIQLKIKDIRLNK